MKHLNDLPRADVVGARNTVEIHEVRARMTFRVEGGSTSLAGYRADDPAWGSDSKRPDGILLTEELVCFAELKSGLDDDTYAKACEQIRAGVDHFARLASGSHGDAHHDQWARPSDLPIAAGGRASRPFAPDREHRVRGVIVTHRLGTRRPPSSYEVAGRTVRVVVLQRHSGRGLTTVSLDALNEELG